MSYIKDLNEFICGDNYLDVNKLIESKQVLTESHNAIGYYIEIDTDNIMWLIFNYRSYGILNTLLYNPCIVINTTRYYNSEQDDWTIYIRSKNSPKIQIFNHCIFPSGKNIEICCKLPDDSNLSNMFTIQSTRPELCVFTFDYYYYITTQNIVTDHYLIYDQCIYPLDYLPNDVFIEPQPHKLLLFKHHSTTILANFFNRYQIKGSDLIIATLDSNLDPLTNINIIYRYLDIDTFIECNDGILICEFPNGDLSVTICETVYVQLSWI